MDSGKLEFVRLTKGNGELFLPFLPPAAEQLFSDRGCEGAGCFYRAVPAGAALWRQEREEIRLLAIAVEGKLRRRGIGSFLLQILRRAAENRNAQRVNVRFERIPLAYFESFLQKNGFEIQEEGGRIYEIRAGQLEKGAFFSAMPLVASGREILRFDAIDNGKRHEMKCLTQRQYPPLAGKIMEQYSFVCTAEGEISAYVLLTDTPDGIVVNQVYCGKECKTAEFRAVIQTAVQNAAALAGEETVLCFPAFHEKQEELVSLMMDGMLPVKREILQAVLYLKNNGTGEGNR